MRHSLLVVLIGLIASSAALAQTEAPAACGLREPGGPRPRGFGTVLGIEDAAMSRITITRREAQRGGAIDPRYLNDLRVRVRQDDGIVDNFDVPAGMRVHVGGRVRLQGSYRSVNAACSYIPHMAIPNDAPTA